MALTRPAGFRGFHNCEEALSENISLVTRVGVGRALPCRAVCSGVGWLPPSRSARSPVTPPPPAGPEPGLRGKGCLPKPKQPVLLCRRSRACLLGLIAGLCLNPLQGEELSTIQNGVTIVS